MKDGKQGELRKGKVAGAASCFAKFMPHLLVKESNPTVFRPKSTELKDYIVKLLLRCGVSNEI